MMLCYEYASRRQQVPVLQYITSTYFGGLPLYENNPALQAHTVNAIQTIFMRVLDLPPEDARTHMQRLVEAYTACQAVQGRVIDSIYGQLTGRDKSLREQVLVVVDEQKQRILDEVSLSLHPAAGSMSDAFANQQVSVC
jgi:hypothetical protein